MKVQGRGDLPFFPVTPLESRLPHSGAAAASTTDDQQKEKAPTTPPHERKSVTLFDLIRSLEMSPCNRWSEE